MYAKKMIDLLALNQSDLVVEVASNDGYLLQYFFEEGIQTIGIEPSSGVAEIAMKKGIHTIVDFFGTELASQLMTEKKPQLMVGNNVLAHVPDIHDFIEGFSLLVAEDGIITFEFPHLSNLIRNTQFDTIYHEHYSYLSVTSLSPIFASHELKIIDVENLSTHGGSIRIYVAKVKSTWKIKDSVARTLLEEQEIDPRNRVISQSLQDSALSIKIDLLNELIKCKREGTKVAAYGAAAKGNTLLNYSGIDSDLVDYVVDLNPHKKGCYLPGSRIPVVGIEELSENRPDVLLVMPWNLADEIKAQLVGFTDSGMKLLRAIPKLEYF